MSVVSFGALLVKATLGMLPTMLQNMIATGWKVTLMALVLSVIRLQVWRRVILSMSGLVLITLLDGLTVVRYHLTPLLPEHKEHYTELSRILVARTAMSEVLSGELLAKETLGMLPTMLQNMIATGWKVTLMALVLSVIRLQVWRRVILSMSGLVLITLLDGLTVVRYHLTPLLLMSVQPPLY